MFNQEIREELDTLIHNIIWLRKHHGLSQKQMAKILHIGVKSLQHLEQGEIPSHLTLEIFSHIHRYFGICPYDQLKIRLDGEKNET